MKRLHKMMLGQYIGPLVISFVIVLFILLMQFVWLYVDDLMGKGLDALVILELMFYAAASFVPLALPLAILVSSIMTMGGLGENSELIPLRSSGMHLSRILWPLFMLVAILSVGSFFFSNNVMPVANLKFKSLLWDVRQKKPALNLQPGVFYEGISGFRIRIEDKDDDTGQLEDVLIYDHRGKDRGNGTVIRAESGFMRISSDGARMVLELTQARIYDERPPETGASDFPMLRGTSDKEIISIDLSGLSMARTDEDLFSEHYEMLSMSALVAAEDSMRRQLEKRTASQEKNLRGTFKVTRDTSVMVVGGTYTTMEDYMRKASPHLRFSTYDLALQLAKNNKNFIDRSLHEREERRTRISKFGIEWHRKIMLATACLVFFFIGAPLGSIIRKGGLGAPTVFAIIFFLIFHITSFSMERLVISGKLEPFPGMWISTLVLLPIGLYLTYQAATDSPLFDRDAYARNWDKLKQRFLTKGNEGPSIVS